MRLLLYKEFRLAISPLYGLVSLFGLFVLLPQWPYLVALMYFFFVAVPNSLNAAKAQNDLGFTVMLPIRKRDVVRARVASFALLELLNMIVASAAVAAKLAGGGGPNFLIDANVAYIGAGFAMYGLFNLVFFPLFYRSAHRVGMPLLVASLAALAFATGIEALNLAVPEAARWLDGVSAEELLRQVPVAVAGILVFLASTLLATRLSATRFERLDL